ncbi:inositol monophosphatase [Amycolatopsis rhabdoformis]|uniref:Inositol monophosphatase n=1 Tax=Amycolatopsis rhabdoformis TaxID=1448059 RepID=A0ABZ1IIG5_9PSEU|nr:inositol monophosphatase [Amycolatopsis rhabdoformis]WSE34245.1 inositol monophosphatase [Amycolatopsis rhabdoformis]
MTPTLLDGMITAAEAAGRVLAARPAHPAPTTFAEFRRTFDALEHSAEADLRESLAKLRPGVAWADEIDPVLAAGEHRWVVDLADGAVQLLHGLPYWCVSITLVEDTVPVAAVIRSEVRGETYHAVAGGGAFLDAERLTSPAEAELPITLIGTSQPPFIGTQPEAVGQAGRSLAAVLPHVGAVRNLGPTSLQIADVAAGRMDGFWEYGHDTGNLLGASLIAAEAGLVVTDAEGVPWHPRAGSFLTAPARTHAALLDLLKAV